MANIANEFSEPITLKEVRTGIRSLKNNTSVGYDCISNEMLKYSSSSMVQCICKLFNLVYESGCEMNPGPRFLCRLCKKYCKLPTNLSHAMTAKSAFM